MKRRFTICGNSGGGGTKIRDRLISLFTVLSMLIALFPVFELPVYSVETKPVPTPTISLGETRSYQGGDLTEITSGQWQSGAGNYTVTKDGLTIHAVENAKGSTASYVLQPFTMSMTVPPPAPHTIWRSMCRRSSSGAPRVRPRGSPSWRTAPMRTGHSALRMTMSCWMGR